MAQKYDIIYAYYAENTRNKGNSTFKSKILNQKPTIMNKG